jgi:hypothetical protein
MGVRQIVIDLKDPRWQYLMKLFHQDEPPTDPVERHKWKLIRHARHYGIGSDRLKTLFEEVSS